MLQNKPFFIEYCCVLLCPISRYSIVIGLNTKKMDITHHLKIKADRATIYKAIASQKGIMGWWSKDCSVASTVGGTSTLIFDKQGTKVEMGFSTLELVPNQKVVWEATENANPAWIGTHISTEITEAKDGCSVIFSHSGFDAQWEGKDPFELTKGGWEHFVSSLVSYCETGVGQPW